MGSPGASQQDAFLPSRSVRRHMACFPLHPQHPGCVTNRGYQMTAHLKPHDRVSWSTPQGVTKGKGGGVISTHTPVDVIIVDASKAEPYYEVESEKSGKHAVHRGDALRRLK